MPNPLAIIKKQSDLIKELIRICGEKVQEATVLFFEVEKYLNDEPQPKPKRGRGRPRKVKT